MPFKTLEGKPQMQSGFRTSMSKSNFNYVLLHPKYWLTWLAFGIWYLLSLLPYKTQLNIGRILGKIFYRVATERRMIAECNIQLCYPELTAQQQKQRVRGVMTSLGIAVMESGMAWFWPKDRLQGMYNIKGLEHLQKAQDEGCGVILMSIHFTHIDLCIKFLGMEWSLDGFYRAHKNPVYDLFQRRGRERHIKRAQAISRGDLRGMIRALKNGRAMIYAPDQDYGPSHSTFVPFFGVQTATVTATSKLAKLGKAKLIPFGHQRRDDGSGYDLVIHPAFEDYPSKNVDEDALRINQFIEARIQEQPDKYLWVHRRFKTRPPGEDDVYLKYGVPAKKRRKK